MRKPFLWLSLITVAICGALIVIAAATASVSGQTVWPEATKALISILAVAVIGGVVKLLLDLHVRERDDRKAEIQFLKDTIAEIESIRSGIEHARFLVRAHRSASSYRDRMQDLIELRVRTDALKRRVETHWPRGRNEDVVMAVSEKSRAISTYLKRLSAEYEREYKPVADQQRIDEAVVTEQIKKYSESVAGPCTQPPLPRPEPTWTAWARLTHAETFPCLADLLSEEPDSGYEREVRPGCERVVRALTGLLWDQSARTRQPVEVG